MINTLERCNKKMGMFPLLSMHGNAPANSEGLWGILGGRLAWYQVNVMRFEWSSQSQ